MTRRGFRSAWWCLAILSALAIAAWAATQPKHRALPHAEPALPLVFRFSPTEVHTFEVRVGQQSRSFERRADGGLQGSGDPAVAERALAMLFRARVERRIPAANAGSEGFGLDRPTLEVVLRRVLNQGEYRLRFGAMAPDGLSRYVHFEGIPEVITLPDYHRENLEALFRDG